LIIWILVYYSSLRTKPWFPFNPTFVAIGYTGWSIKTWHFTFAHIFANYWPIFKIFFTGTLCRQFAITCSLYISPYHKRVFTLPCEISRWAHVCCINVGSTSNFDADDVLKRCWICKLDRRRNVDIVSTSPYKRILNIDPTLSLRWMYVQWIQCGGVIQLCPHLFWSLGAPPTSVARYGSKRTF